MNVFKPISFVAALLFYMSVSFANDFLSGTGTVVETMDSAGYTYVLLEEDGRWVAGKQFQVEPGEVVRYDQAVEMGKFHSRSLNRDFEQIAFSQVLEVISPKIRPDHAESNAIATVGEQLGISKSTAIVAPEVGDIAPLEGGQTIDSIRTGSEQLKGQEVAVRAKVMKVSMNILGKNWITLKDGTGSEPNTKLLATTTETVEIGDMVIARGIVNTNVDLGSGYKYAVVLEEAVFSD